MRVGHCTNSVYIFTNIDDINNILIYVDRSRQNLNACSDFFKNKEFNEQEGIKLWRSKYETIRPIYESGQCPRLQTTRIECIDGSVYRSLRWYSLNS